MIEKKISHYTILGRLGAGGMGEVYRARDEKLGREVALKLLPAEFTSDAKRIARFHREAKLASQLSHTNIATIYEAGESDGQYFIAMELVKGETLISRVKLGGLSLDRILDIAIPLAEGLEEAHRNGVVHRDLKPANVMLDERGRVKILDFGLSRPLPENDLVTAGLTSSGQVMGTPHYMSPEQMRGEEVDARTDLFSLGVILYELATGIRPFEGDSLAVVMNAVLEKQPSPILPVNPRLGELFAHTVERLLEKDPELRSQSAAGVAADLKSLKKPTTTIVPAKKRGMPLALVALALAVVGVGIYALRPEREESTGGAEKSLADPASDKLTLAIVPFSFPDEDEEAATIAETLTYGLFEAVGIPDIDLITTTVLRYKAKHKSSDPDYLDPVTAMEIAREEGAQVIVVTALERRSEGLSLRMELLDAVTGHYRTSKHIPIVRRSNLPEHVDECAAAILDELGFASPKDVEAVATLSDNPGALEMWAKGREAYARADYVDAEQYFRIAVEFDAEFAQAHYYRARSLFFRDGWATASNRRRIEETLDQAARFGERLSETDGQKLRLFREIARSAGGDWTKGSLARARSLAGANPRDEDALDLWRICTQSLEGSFAEMIKSAQALLSLDPEHVRALTDLRWAAATTDQADLARESAERLILLAPDSGDAPYAYLQIGQVEKAHDLARRLGREPRNFSDRYWSIFVALSLEDYEWARDTAELGWKDDPFRFNDLLCAALAGLGQIDRARTVAFRGGAWTTQMVSLGASVRAGSNDPATRLAKIGQTARVGWPDQAERELDEGVVPSHLMKGGLHRLVVWVQGEIAHARAQEDRALDLFLRAVPRRGEVEDVTAASWSTFLRHRAGHELREAGRFEEAQELLLLIEQDAARRTYPQASVIPRIRAGWDLAVCRDALGDPDGAVSYLQDFLEHWHEPDPGFPEIADALEMYEFLTGRPYVPEDG